MIKRVGPAIDASAKTTAPRAMVRSNAKALVGRPKVPTSRVDQLVAIIDHCSAARDLADRMGEPFLAYMLAMAIQETRTQLRNRL